MLRRALLLAFVSGVLSSPVARAAAWPFDQRTVLLVRGEGRDFPDDLTSAQILDLFVRKGRVRWVMERGGRGQITPVSVPRDFQWQSTANVRNLGLRFKVDGIVALSQKDSELDLRWYSTFDGQPLFFEKVSLPSMGHKPEEVEARRKRLADWLEDIWLRIPGQGYVVKRDLDSVSFEGAVPTGVKAGDTLEIRRLEQAERHPLLKTLIGIRSSSVGLATVTAVAEPFSTAHIDYESQLDPIREGDRYEVRAKPAVAAAAPAVVAGDKGPVGQKMADGRTVMPIFGDKSSAATAPAKEEPKPGETVMADGDDPANVRVFDLQARLGWSTMTHSEAVSGGSYDLTGGGPALQVMGRAYITREWVMEGQLGVNRFGGKSADNVYGDTFPDSDAVRYRIGGGYRFIFLDHPDVPGELTFTLGYQSFGFSITQLDSDIAPVGKTYGGLDLGIQLKVPVAEKFSMFVGGSRLLSASLDETPETTGESSSATLWQFEAGGLYKILPEGYMSFGIEAVSASANMEGNGTRAQSALSSTLSATTYFAGYMHRF